VADRLRLVVIELAVHGDDLAVSVGRDDESVSEEAGRVAVDALMTGARARHGDRAVLRALARRERATADVFPVL
jgi:hypothetical protein